jgi:hypothetical protein
MEAASFYGVYGIKATVGSFTQGHVKFRRKLLKHLVILVLKPSQMETIVINQYLEGFGVL